VAGAYVPNYPPPVVIESRKTLRDSDRPVVTGVVRNTRPRRVKVLVLAAFYDASGVPVRRPFTEMILDGETTSPAQFVGPPGAERGTLFIGDMIY
jgi:hypothetical protein